MDSKALYFSHLRKKASFALLLAPDDEGREIRAPVLLLLIARLDVLQFELHALLLNSSLAVKYRYYISPT